MMERMKKLVAALLCVAMTAAFVPAFAVGAEEESTITRSEWIARIVETFSMTIENDDNMPDNYYSDLTEDMDCYYNILVATEFGIIDLEAGEAFCPDEAATREFAAQTLNFALLFQLDEDAEYTFAEYETVTYPDDIQIAINRGWFALEDGYFLPDAAITEEEAAAMLAEAADVIESDKIDPDYVNTYEFADGVIEVPQGTDIEFDGDTVTIYDPDVAIEAGDIFVVYNGTLAVALVAHDVESIDGALVITATDEGAEDAITYADAQGSIAIDVEDFEFDEVTTFSIMNTETNESEDMTLTLMEINYDPKTSTVTATKKITVGSSTAGTLSVKIKNIDLDYNSTPALILTADTEVSTSIDFDFGNITPAYRAHSRSAA
ncbi:MAG: hypothetical protein LUG52_03740 [Clostridia bacterium]|nr:hypothetical protein [Clostridia bacterium]